MAKWCLTKDAEQKLLDALRADKDPQKMVDRGTEGRRAWFAKVAGKENAIHLNTLYESRLLLKSEKQGLSGFVKQLGGAKEVKRDMLSKVERLDTALNKAGVNQFLGDLTDRRLGLDVTDAEYKVLTDMSEKLGKMKANGEKFGALQVAFDNYVEELKLGKQGIRQMLGERGTQFKSEFRTNPPLATAKLILDSAKTISNTTVQLVATFDDSFFGRQGIVNLLTWHPKVWGKAFAKSFTDFARVMGGKRTTDALKAELYDDPLYISGELQKAGILNLSEEQYPASFLGRIPAIGRPFRAFEEAFVNGSLRMRTEIYKLMRQAKVDRGVALNDAEVVGMGRVTNSMSAKGHLGRTGDNPVLRLLMWAPKMLKADADVLTAHLFSDIPRADKIVAIKNLTKIVATAVAIESVATGLFNQKVELDPRSSDFLQINGKIGFLRGMPAIVTFMARMITGETKNSSGEIVKYEPGIGKRTRLDAVISFLRGKAPPGTGGVYDVLAQQDYYGNVPTFTSLLFQRGIPISIQNVVRLTQNPSMDNAFGVIGDFFGLNSSLNPEPNIKSSVIPLGKPQKSDDVITVLGVYAKAFQTDPETAFNRFFTGQKILKTAGGAIIVERMSVGDSQAIKKKYGANTKQVKLDHTIPLELGGSNDTSNLKLVSTSEWSSYTKVENALGKALKNNKISKSEAQSLIKKFKAITNGTQRKEYGQKLINKYK